MPRSILHRARKTYADRPRKPISGYFRTTNGTDRIVSVYRIKDLEYFDPVACVIGIKGKGKTGLIWGPELKEIPAPPGEPTGPFPFVVVKAPAPDAASAAQTAGDEIASEDGPSYGHG